MNPRHLPAWLSFSCGFISLSLEILWVRLYSFTQFSTPAAFGFVLMAYLVGIAFGAYIGSRQCRLTPAAPALWRCSAWALCLSACLSLLLPFAFASLHRQTIANPVLDMLLIAMGSGVLAYVFPIAHHLGANNDAAQQGQRFAKVYTANVAGAALGPLVTGYILLDALSLQQALLLLALLQCAGAAFFACKQIQAPARTRTTLASAAVGGILVAVGAMLPAHDLIEQVATQDAPPHTVLENRHGIITLYSGKASDDDIVYGGNVYDGRTNVDVERNSNGLHRPLLLTALHPQPQRVLMLGLSIGSWLSVINTFPGVKSIDVLELNPGYVTAAQRYPAQAQALQDPRVQLIADDGRRWLRLHPERQYDLIIMNTTWHWRANISLLLSSDFFEQVQRHMRPHAILAFNATGSADAFFTAASVFAHAYRYDNFVYAADHDFRDRKQSAAAAQTYASLQMHGQPLFAPNSPAIDRYLQRPFITVEQLQSHMPRPPELVTDRNMLTEFRYGRALYP